MKKSLIKIDELAPIPLKKILYFFSAAAVGENRLEITGGRMEKSKETVPLNIVMSYDVKQDQWTEGVPMTRNRYLHGSIALGSTLYVFGGRAKTDKFEFETSIESYDFARG